MNREEARQYILMRSKDYLTPDKSGKGFICPICGSGTGKSGTGITTKDGVHFTCWAGCFTNADIIDIIGLENHETDYNGKLQAAARAFNISIESYHRATAQEDFADGNQKQPESKRITQPAIHNTQHTTPPEKAETDYTDFYLQAGKDLDKTDYYRGLSKGVLRLFNVGYVESWRHPNAPKMEPSPRLIIPTSKTSYLARYAGAGDFINYRGEKENKSKVGKVHVFNAEALGAATSPLFITEGEIDAMSFYEVGGAAVGLGSISYVKLFLAEVEKRKPSQPLIIALDNEREPEKQARVDACATKLVEGLRELNVSCYRLDVYGEHKDANEALNADREAFRAAVSRALAQVEDAEAAALEAERDALRREAVAYSLQSFLKDIEDSKKAAFIPTGFSPLDNILDGGLYAGLYVVGAISSLGKTTLALQLCDNVAKAGHDVLIFSLEMARNELIAKSVSRITAELDESKTRSNAKTTRGILTGTRYADYSQTERELIERAVRSYAEYAKNIYITEGIGNVGVAEIREKVQKHVKLTGKAPVVLIDYLQIIATPDPHLTDKQATDKNVLELKRLSRDYSIPIFAISSFNRNSYTDPVNMSAYKESGAVEYSSDVLIGLQYEGMDYRDGESEKDRDKRIRKLMRDAVELGKQGKPQSIQVKVLKNRNGSKGDCTLAFYPMFNRFTTERVAPAEDEDGEDWSKTEGGYRKSKKSKRDQERERLNEAFYAVQRDDFTADLTELADELDKSKKQVANLIAEYGGFTIIGETVQLARRDESPAFTELDDTEEIPF